MNRFISDASRVRLAREIAGESIALLKNDGLLPLSGGKPVAVFGKGQFELYIGGSGSGASSNKNAAILIPELKKRGVRLVEPLAAFYEAGFDPEKGEKERAEMFKKFSGLVASGALYEWFGTYTPPEAETDVPDELVAAAAGGRSRWGCRRCRTSSLRRRPSKRPCPTRRDRRRCRPQLRRRGMRPPV